MFHEVAEQLGAVVRQVANAERDGVEIKVVRLEQTYDADIEDVWDACTSAERLPRWFLPITGDLRVGGRYQLEGNAGGEILACEPPHRVSVTWEFGGDTTWVDVRLAETADGRTTLLLEHAAHVDTERWPEFGPGAVGIGWDLGLLGLRHHLAGAPAFDPAEVAEWYGTPVARDFMTRCGERWCAADIEAGTDEAQARAAAGRTMAAYTGGSDQPGESAESVPAAGTVT